MWNSKLGNAYPKAEIEAMDKEMHMKLKKLRQLPENRQCADCTGTDVLWAVCNIGSFVCVRCASLHRGIGTHISKVKGCSGTYLWGPDEMASMIGNKKVQEIYGGTKPSSAASDQTVRQFLLDRYESKRWFNQQRYDEVKNGTAGENLGEDATTTRTASAAPASRSKDADFFQFADASTGVANNSTSAATSKKRSSNKLDQCFDLLDFGDFEKSAPKSSAGTSQHRGTSSQGGSQRSTPTTASSMNNFDPFATEPFPAFQKKEVDPFADDNFDPFEGFSAEGVQSSTQEKKPVFSWPDAQVNNSEKKTSDIPDDWFADW